MRVYSPEPSSDLRDALAFEEALSHLSQLSGIPRGTVFEDAFPGFESEVETIELGVAFFQQIHYAQGLDVVLETAIILHAFIERILAGVAERSVTQATVRPI